MKLKERVKELERIVSEMRGGPEPLPWDDPRVPAEAGCQVIDGKGTLSFCTNKNVHTADTYLGWTTDSPLGDWLRGHEIRNYATIYGNGWKQCKWERPVTKESLPTDKESLTVEAENATWLDKLDKLVDEKLKMLTPEQLRRELEEACGLVVKKKAFDTQSDDEVFPLQKGEVVKVRDNDGQTWALAKYGTRIDANSGYIDSKGIEWKQCRRAPPNWINIPDDMMEAPKGIKGKIVFKCKNGYMANNHVKHLTWDLSLDHPKRIVAIMITEVQG